MKRDFLKHLGFHSQTITMSNNKYPVGGYAPGNYHCTCCVCGNKFHGDKRAVECEPCAIEGKAKFDALSSVEQEEVVKRNIETFNQLFKNNRSND